MGMSDHESQKMGKDEWLTPAYITDALGEFDLDPCSPVIRPWETAQNYYTMFDNGLSKEWIGRVWCNPPYGRETVKWLCRLAEHGDGIALIFARTETKMFFSEVWEKADALLFIKGRIRFHHVCGKRADAAGAPSVLVAYGKNNASVLENSSIKGAYVPLIY